MATTKAGDFKRRAHALIDRLPEDAGWKDLAYEVSIIQDIEAGLADSEAGRVVENNEVRRRFALPDLKRMLDEMLAARGGPLSDRETAAADTALGKRKRRRK